jgi:hypothetical protein
VAVGYAAYQYNKTAGGNRWIRHQPGQWQMGDDGAAGACLHLGRPLRRGDRGVVYPGHDRGGP